jgi:cytidylate kinase
MNTKLQIIGLAGTNGSGKDTVGELLAEQHKYLFISVTALLRTECQRRNLPVERENLRMISAEWRRELGLGVLVDKAVAEYEIVKDNYAGVVMASIRNPGEADRIHEFGGTMVWIDADPQTRYDRIQANVATRGRAEEDNKTFEQFLAEEETEMHTPEGGDSAMLNSAAVKDLCDVFLLNDSSDLTSLSLTIQLSLKL